MKKVFCFVLLSACAAVAQQTAAASQNPVTDTVRQLLTRQSHNLTAAAEQMPAEKYSYHPTEQQMTFGKLVEHIIESNNFLCARISGQAEPKDEVKDSDGKDKLVPALKQSFEFCTSAMAKVQDADLSGSVEMWGGRKAPKAAAVIGLTNDWADHYGAAAIYLRLNGMLPPTAQRQGGMQKGAGKGAEKK